MKKNVCFMDSVIRLGLAIAIFVLYLLNMVNKSWNLALGILAIILLASAITSFCPIYAMLGIKTRKKEEQGTPAGSEPAKK
jgi:ABC-type bacteriocin/lantibiotic exporter with double-glycine peptidase domain